MNDKLKSNIKDVIGRNMDAVKGYEKASDKVKSPALETAFIQQSRQRKQFAIDLENQAQVLDPDTGVSDLQSGSFEGNLHRTWMDVKTAFSSDNEDAIVEECIRGEKAALNEYNDLLSDSDIPEGTRILMEGQRETVKTCISDLKKIESALN